MRKALSGEAQWLWSVAIQQLFFAAQVFGLIEPYQELATHRDWPSQAPSYSVIQALSSRAQRYENRFLTWTLLSGAAVCVAIYVLGRWVREQQAEGNRSVSFRADVLRSLWAVWLMAALVTVVVQVQDDDPLAGMPGRGHWLGGVHLAGVVLAVGMGVVVTVSNFRARRPRPETSAAIF